MLDKIKERWREGGAKSIAIAAKERVVEPARTVVLLKVDLTAPANVLRPRDRAAMEAEGLSVEPFDLAKVSSMLAREAPERLASAETRGVQGMDGFIFRRKNEVLGYVFWTPGSDDPRARVHSDLEWLDIHPHEDEVYAFDYFVPENARGHTALFVRAVQAEHAALGFTAAYGYVYLSNRPALWTYRTTGWKEVGRIEEQRVLQKLAIVGGKDVYWMDPFSRRKISLLGKLFGR